VARDFYEVLGVSRTATDDEIRRAHRKLAKQFHPDRNKSPEAASRFSEVQEAYEALSDANKRARYDQFGHAGVSSPGAPHGSGGAGGGWQDVGMRAEDLEEIFRRAGGGAGGINDFFRDAGLGGGASRGRSRRPEAQPGEDISLDVVVDFLTAALGGVRNVSLHDDAGKVISIDVKIPPGVPSGGTVRVAGKGHAGRGGGPPGDLLLRVKVAPHPWFTRDGLDVAVEVPLTIAEAALGTSVEIPLLKGSIAMKVPAGTSSGKRLRVAGRGIAPPSGPPGDFYAVVQVVAPTTLSESDSLALREIGGHLPNPREGRWT
jgi:DnaJ-class molecular chaperone